MVQAHQKQIVAWEEDRQRVSSIKHITYTVSYSFIAG